VGKCSKFYISKTGGDFVAKFLGFLEVRIARRVFLGDRYKYATCVLSSLSCTLRNIGVLWPKGWMYQYAAPVCTELGLGPGDIVLDGNPVPPPTERGTAAPHFSAHVFVVKRSLISAATELLLQIWVGPKISAWQGPNFRRFLDRPLGRIP